MGDDYGCFVWMRTHNLGSRGRARAVTANPLSPPTGAKV
jgi:hypothetical protein